MQEVKLGRYKHFKGTLYEVICVARDCENPEKILVVYKALYDSEKFGKNQIWIREINDFLGEKEFSEDKKYNGRTFKKGESVKRFELIK